MILKGVLIHDIQLPPPLIWSFHPLASFLSYKTSLETTAHAASQGSVPDTHDGQASLWLTEVKDPNPPHHHHYHHHPDNMANFALCGNKQ